MITLNIARLRQVDTVSTVRRVPQFMILCATKEVTMKTRSGTAPVPSRKTVQPRDPPKLVARFSLLSNSRHLSFLDNNKDIRHHHHRYPVSNYESSHGYTLTLTSTARRLTSSYPHIPFITNLDARFTLSELFVCSNPGPSESASRVPIHRFHPNIDIRPFPPLVAIL